MYDHRNALRGLRPMFTRHCLDTIKEKGFSFADVVAALERPNRVYPSGSHPGQYRVCGAGLCIVGKPEGSDFICITVYLDEVVTDVRPDQLLTPEGRRFSEFGRTTSPWVRNAASSSLPTKDLTRKVN